MSKTSEKKTRNSCAKNKCMFIFKSGNRKGETCNKKCKQEFCGDHNKHKMEYNKKKYMDSMKEQYSGKQKTLRGILGKIKAFDFDSGDQKSIFDDLIKIIKRDKVLHELVEDFSGSEMDILFIADLMSSEYYSKWQKNREKVRAINFILDGKGISDYRMDKIYKSKVTDESKRKRLDTKLGTKLLHNFVKYMEYYEKLSRDKEKLRKTRNSLTARYKRIQPLMQVSRDMYQYLLQIDKNYTLKGYLFGKSKKRNLVPSDNSDDGSNTDTNGENIVEPEREDSSEKEDTTESDQEMVVRELKEELDKYKDNIDRYGIDSSSEKEIINKSVRDILSKLIDIKRESKHNSILDMVEEYASYADEILITIRDTKTLLEKAIEEEEGEEKEEGEGEDEEEKSIDEEDILNAME